MAYNILYFGKDDVFFKAFEKVVSECEINNQISLSSISFDEIDETAPIPKIVPEIIAKSPDIIMIDFSFNTKKVIMLARHIRMTLDVKSYTFIGLLNQAVSGDAKKENDHIKDSYYQASLTQFPIIHYKGTELKHILFDCLYMQNDDKSLRQTTAKFSNCKININAKYFSTITNFLNDAMIIETSLNFSPGQLIELESYFLSLIDKKFVEVSKSSKEFLQTKFSKRYRLNTKFGFQLNEAQESVDTKEDKVENDEAEEQAEVNPQDLLPRIDTDKLEVYINSLDKSGSKKSSKLLLVQQGLDVLSQLSESLSSLPYLIRYQTSFRPNLKMVHNFRPDVIAIELADPVDIVNSEVPKSVESDEPGIQDSKPDISDKDGKDPNEEKQDKILSLDTIAFLVSQLSSIDGYTPIIKIFNCKTSTSEMRKNLNYPMILGSEEKMALPLLMDMLEIFNNKYKDNEKETNDPLIQKGEKNFNVYGLNPISRFKLNVPITVTSISEHEITFLSEMELPLRGIISLTLGEVKIYVTVIPPIDPLENVKGTNHYFGIINGVTTLDLQGIRQYINALFLSEKRQKEQEEREAFAKANAAAREKKNQEMLERLEKEKKKESLKDDLEEHANNAKENNEDLAIRPEEDQDE